MRTEKNVQVVKDFFAAIGSGDKQRLLSLVRKPFSIVVGARQRVYSTRCSFNTRSPGAWPLPGNFLSGKPWTHEMSNTQPNTLT